MPRLVRRRPLRERITDLFNIQDWLLWISEEIETRDWDSRTYANPLGFGLHFVLLIARANSGSEGYNNGDDVFGDVPSGSGWLSYLVRTKIVNTRLHRLMLTKSTVYTSCLSIDGIVNLKCTLNFLAQTTLPPFRKLYRGNTQYPFCSQSARRLLTGILLSSPFLLQYARGHGYKCAVQSSPRPDSRRVGDCCLGSYTDLPTIVLSI